MKCFVSDNSYNNDFDAIDNLKEYPFVGSKFSQSNLRLLVYGDNAAVEDMGKEPQLKTRISNSMDGYVFTQNESWNKAFRNFVSMSTNQKKSFSDKSESIDEIIEYVSSLCFINFINGVVESPSPKNVKVKNPEIHLEINSQIINILNPTHIICWGDSPYGRLKKISSLKVLRQTTEVFGKRKTGFAIAEIQNKKTNQIIKVLRIHHPGWDKVGPYLKETHFIMNSFFNS